MAFKKFNSDYIKDPLRGELINRLTHPRESCSEYARCSALGHVFCEMSRKSLQEFGLSVSTLLDLSNVPGWYFLRGAIRELDRTNALKTCMMIEAFVAVRGKIRDDENLAKAKDYEPAHERGADRINSATKSINELRQCIELAQPRQPDVLAIKNFIDCKRALCVLVDCGLIALRQLYEIEKKAISPEVLEVVYKTQFRQQVDEILHESSSADGARFWEEIEVLLVGIEEIVRRPKPSEWRRDAPALSGINGNRLRQNVKKVTAADEARLVGWFDLLAPGLYKRMKTETDQVALLVDVMERQPQFPPLLSYTVQLAFAHQSDLVKLRQEK